MVVAPSLHGGYAPELWLQSKGAPKYGVQPGTMYSAAPPKPSYQISSAKVTVMAAMAVTKPTTDMGRVSQIAGDGEKCALPLTFVYCARSKQEPLTVSSCARPPRISRL
jgi:hypothetical protein